MHAAGKMFVKIYLKAIRDTFFSQYVEFPNILIQQNGKVDIFRLAGRPPHPPHHFPHLVGHPDLPNSVVLLLKTYYIFY